MQHLAGRGRNRNTHGEQSAPVATGPTFSHPCRWINKKSRRRKRQHGWLSRRRHTLKQASQPNVGLPFSKSTGFFLPGSLNQNPNTPSSPIWPVFWIFRESATAVTELGNRRMVGREHRDGPWIGRRQGKRFSTPAQGLECCMCRPLKWRAGCVACGPPWFNARPFWVSMCYGREAPPRQIEAAIPLND